MYTTLALLQEGWHLEREALGMSPIEDERSAWNGVMPAPQMVQNQLGHLLELRMVELDAAILSTLHKMIEKRRLLDWPTVTVAIFLLLHVRELDAARIIYWKRYEDTGRFWIHPIKPKALIDEEIFSYQSLRWHYHTVYSQKPLTFNWDAPASKLMLNNNDKLIRFMKTIQSIVSRMQDGNLIGRTAADVYVDGNPRSVAFTISSLLFASRENFAEVVGFG
ncbi:hypothetical protein F5883DRAFT_438010 [Diaporthe sp. PMI_573]|nr:hypothetical protein F5883DRAFT_438010 [Diaporthaceae sp. PMI_573]